MRFATGSMIVLWLGSVATVSGQPGHLEVKNEAFQEVEIVGPDSTKTTHMVPADKIVPGDEVIYLTTVKNIGQEPAENVVIDNPVPGSTALAPNSTFGEQARVEYSVDGGKRWGSLADLRVTAPNGSKRPARVQDVTHLRFVLTEPLPPGEEGRFGFRAILQ